MSAASTPAAIATQQAAADGAEFRARPPWAAKLTSRQWGIAVLVGDGLDGYSVARTLGLTDKTVRNQLSLMYRLLGIHNRTQLALMVKEGASPAASPTETRDG